MRESCCPEEPENGLVQISVQKSSCCLQEFDFKKIEDDFSQVSANNFTFNFVVLAELKLLTASSNNRTKYEINSCYDLPPPKFGKQLLNTIHQLKIDLPFC